MNIEKIIKEIQNTNNYEVGESYRKIGFRYLNKEEPTNGTEEEIKKFVQEVQNFNNTILKFNKTIAKKFNKIGLTTYWIHDKQLQNKIYKIYDLQYTRKYEVQQISILLNQYEA